MKTQKAILTTSLFFVCGLTMTFAQGSAFTYQGRLSENGVPVNRTQEMIFRPFNVPTGGTQLAFPNLRTVAVSNGLFTVTLDFALPIFNGDPMWLEIQISTNSFSGIVATLTPRQPLTPAPYAIFAGTAGTVPSGAIGSAQLANSINLGTTTNNGRLDVYRTAANTPAISLIGSSAQMNAYGDDGQTKAQVEAAIYGGRLTTWDEMGNETASVGSATGAGGTLQLFQANGILGVNLDGDSTGANGGGQLGLRAPDGSSAVFLSGSSGAGNVYVRNTNGNNRVFIDGQSSGGGGGVTLYDGSGTATITLRGDATGEGKITTQVLQITGGSDLSEQFDIAAPKSEPAPGMIVCIDPDHPGQLVESIMAYDRTVAGVMSGAGGVKPGMLMGQQGTAADGKHPVALSGRVYCEADASNGPIHPGDLLTTSNTHGRAMKVTDYDKAHGAIIGKAMSSLDKGEGLVLVLVTLQ